MKTKAPSLKALQKGQLYKVGDSHIEIVEVGKRLAHFKHFKLTSKTVPVQLRSIPDVQELLRDNGAKLVKSVK